MSKVQLPLSLPMRRRPADVQALSQAFFACKPARRGLSAELGELTAGLVWLEVSAARAAQPFCTIRERIAAERKIGLEKLEGPIELEEPCFGDYRQGKRGRGKLPVCGLLKRSGEVRVILPTNCSERQLPGAMLEKTASCLSTASRTFRAAPSAA
jgi:hypothetical protein